MKEADWIKRFENYFGIKEYAFENNSLWLISKDEIFVLNIPLDKEKLEELRIWLSKYKLNKKFLGKYLEDVKSNYEGINVKKENYNKALEFLGVKEKIKIHSKKYHFMCIEGNGVEIYIGPFVN